MRSRLPGSTRFIPTLVILGSLLFAALAHAQQPNVTQDDVLFGKVSIIKGKATINGQRLSRGMEVFEGDLIKTAGGKVEIQSGRSKFLIGPFSEIKLGPSLSREQSYLSLIKGTLKSIINRVLFKKRRLSCTFTVKTPTVIAGVRGTEFIVHAAQKAGLILTKDGTVFFTADGKTIQMDPMHMSQGGEGIKPLEAESILLNKQLEDLLKEVEQFVDLRIPPAISEKKNLNNIIARFNLNYASYLVDKKEFEKARKLCFLAFLFADMGDLKAEALVHKATISFRFLNENRTALEDLNIIISRFGDTTHAEHALYYKGLIHFNLEEKEEAAKALKRYMETYPKGRFRDSVLSILQKIPD